ncbi:hypothetical protein SAMN02910292_02550 [Lachnospiraceae bacterium XBB2008]|nr:hypothetical protein SAMN02910292_02550 [Lachnospiraceae bacterium XBB2008]
MNGREYISTIEDDKHISVQVVDQNPFARTDIDSVISELDDQIDYLSSHADKLDYLVAIASGILCGMLDIFWVGDFSLERGRGYAEEEIDGFVKKTSQLLGCKDDDLKSCVAFLEKKFPIPADGNTPDFGGGLQHHLRDFAHHPTIIGLAFSLLTQFTGMSYGTNTQGLFMVVPVPESSKIFIGDSVPDKIFKGTIVWLFHLISDIAGSSSSVGLSGGTGIPGPILSLAKEISTLPLIKDITVNEDSLSKFLSKVFNGTIFAQHDETGKIIKGTEIKFDFRGELGVVAELGRQAIPVIANDCLVRTFYFIRRFAMELKGNSYTNMREFANHNWENVIPFKNPTVTRMLTVATGVFTTIDLAEAVISEKYFVAVNYVGVGRFAVAIGAETSNYLRVRQVKAIKDVYVRIKSNTFLEEDNKIYGRIEAGMNIDKFGLTLDQTEILYNIELLKAMDDMLITPVALDKGRIQALKREWIDEWKEYMELGYADFVQVEGAILHWYDKQELLEKIANNSPEKIWFRLVLLEAMLFEPYFPLGFETDKKGNEVPSKKYKALQNPLHAFKDSTGDRFLDRVFPTSYYERGYIARFRRTYNKMIKEMNEVNKGVIKGLIIATVITVLVVASAGIFAPQIAVALVGASFPGLSGAALTNACLAYLGGGAIAANGLGMLGGTVAIVGGGALIGAGVGVGAGAAVGVAGILGKEATIMQSAKLMVAVREIFLNDEKDIEYSNYIYEKYVDSIRSLENKITDLRLKEQTSSKEETKQIDKELKNLEESAHAMEIAMKSFNRYKSAFEVGMNAQG